MTDPPADSPRDPPLDSSDALRDRWDALRQEDPDLGVRRAAADLEVSEAELVAARCGHGVRRIEADVERLLPRLEALGRLRAVTRNRLFVHEKTGSYEKVYVNPHVSSVIGEDIDLRIFPGRWEHGFAVEDDRGPTLSLRFFDAHGSPVHEIVHEEDSDMDAWEALVQDFLHGDQSAGQEVEPEEEPAGDPSPHDRAVDVNALESDWGEIEDTHDFLGLLRKHDVTRTRAFRLVSDELARPADTEAVRRILESASGQGVDLMVFVRSPGTIQIHHGPVDRVEDAPSGLAVRDPGFDLLVREDDIAEVWVVKKPVETGWVTSVEVFDAHGRLCALFFGCREEGEAEDPAWRTLAEGLP